MSKHNFKIGDKAKVICNKTNSLIVQKAMNKVGVVSSVKNNMIYVRFDKGVWQGLTVLGFFEEEIEHAVKVGEQLMFSFMSKATK